jgi:hypothetical protein
VDTAPAWPERPPRCGCAIRQQHPRDASWAEMSVDPRREALDDVQGRAAHQRAAQWAPARMSLEERRVKADEVEPLAQHGAKQVPSSDVGQAIDSCGDAGSVVDVYRDDLCARILCENADYACATTHIKQAWASTLTDPLGHPRCPRCARSKTNRVEHAGGYAQRVAVHGDRARPKLAEQRKDALPACVLVPFFHHGHFTACMDRDLLMEVRLFTALPAALAQMLDTKRKEPMLNRAFLWLVAVGFVSILPEDHAGHPVGPKPVPRSGSGVR